MPSLHAKFSMPNMPCDVEIDVEDTKGRLQVRASYAQMDFFRLPKEFKAEDFNGDTLKWYIKHGTLHITRADGTQVSFEATAEDIDYKYPFEIAIENDNQADSDDSGAESDTTEHSQLVRIVDKQE